MKSELNAHDYELISAYLDHDMALIEAARFEERLEQDAALRKATAEIRETRRMVRTIPVIHAPRSFVLKPEMVRPRTGAFKYFLSFFQARSLGYGAVLSGLLLVLVFAGDVLMQSREEYPQSQFAMGAVQEAPVSEYAAAPPPAPANVLPAAATALIEALLPTASAEGGPSMQKSAAEEPSKPEGEMQTYAAQEAIVEGTVPKILTTPGPPPMAAPAAAAPMLDTASAGQEGEPLTQAEIPSRPTSTQFIPSPTTSERVIAPSVGQEASDQGSVSKKPGSETEKPPSRWGWRLAELLLGFILVCFVIAALVAFQREIRWR